MENKIKSSKNNLQLVSGIRKSTKIKQRPNTSPGRCWQMSWADLSGASDLSDGWGGCNSGSKKGHLLFGRLVVWSLSAPVCTPHILVQDMNIHPSEYKCVRKLHKMHLCRKNIAKKMLSESKKHCIRTSLFTIYIKRDISRKGTVNKPVLRKGNCKQMLPYGGTYPF